MTRLLVSVRSPFEAELAVAAGADVIDVKEPARGPLGAADWETISEVIDVVDSRVPVSAALGELCDWSKTLPVKLARGLDFVKFGLAGCGHLADWPLRWRDAISLSVLNPTNPGLTAVAVVYADWRTAAAPAPECVLSEARLAGCRAILVDTFDKRGGSLLNLWSPQGIAQFVTAAHEAEMLVAVAGGISLEDLPQALPAMPDLIGVRGAACCGGRAGLLDANRVRQFAQAVHDWPAAPNALVSSFNI